MTKIIKTLVVFAVLLLSSQVTFAGPPTISCGTYRVAQGEQCNAFRQAYDYNGNPINGIQPMQYVNADQQQMVVSNQQQWQQTLLNQAIRVGAGGQVPQGYCSWNGRIQNTAISAGIGAVIGVLIGDNGESARKGAAAGAITGLFVPCDTLQQAQQQGVAQQSGQVKTVGNIGQNGNVVSEPSSCNIEGMNPIRGVSLEDCQKLRGRMVTTSPAVVTKVTSPAYCVITRTKNGNKETKNVANPNGEQSYCEILLADLRDGKKNLEELETVSVQ